jgi:hypothetical protein
MLLLKRLLARRQNHFETEVAQECAYLRRAFQDRSQQKAQERLGTRKRGSFEWFVIEEAARRLAKPAKLSTPARARS